MVVNPIDPMGDDFDDAVVAEVAALDPKTSLQQKGTDPFATYCYTCYDFREMSA